MVRENLEEREGSFIYIEITVLFLGELDQLEEPLYLRSKLFSFLFYWNCLGGCWKSNREMIVTVHSMLQFSSIDFYSCSGLLNK